jgi:hypothetical protein
MCFAQALTLQYVLLAHRMQAPELVALYPSAQKQSVALEEPAIEVWFSGQTLLIPVQHQVPALQTWHLAFAVPLYPASQ